MHLYAGIGPVRSEYLYKMASVGETADKVGLLASIGETADKVGLLASIGETAVKVLAS